MNMCRWTNKKREANKTDRQAGIKHSKKNTQRDKCSINTDNQGVREGETLR